ncbi:hypothetical protein OG417_31350 [Actinoallomurus sp. NBC_01490]|uniref:hypothetical protein n=1 Tax=Actinoallomurus sp. NBC_01490 TaxID=2903557 RepID=UPI002E2F3638|nr:hypothetical protein [Actinoallomurus sp. NBC_01490]
MRRWFLIATAVLTLVSSGCSGLRVGGEDAPFPTISPPGGMKAVSWKNFAFAVPGEWREETDGNGGHHWRDASGETVMTAGYSTMSHCPKEADLRRSEGDTNVTGYAPLRVPGAAGGARIVFDRPSYDVNDATNLLAWLKDCQTELAIEVYATGSVVDDIASSIVAQADD